MVSHTNPEDTQLGSDSSFNHLLAMGPFFVIEVFFLLTLLASGFKYINSVFLQINGYYRLL